MEHDHDSKQPMSDTEIALIEETLERAWGKRSPLLGRLLDRLRTSEQHTDRKHNDRKHNEKSITVASSLSGLKGVVAVVSAAAQGIGQAICLSLASHGARVVCVDLGSNSAAQTAAKITSDGAIYTPTPEENLDPNLQLLLLSRRRRHFNGL